MSDIPVVKHTDRKKLLLFCDWYYPAYKGGGPIQSCGNFAELMSTELDVFIFTSNTDSDGEILKVQSNVWIGLKKKIQIWYSDNYNPHRESLSFRELFKEINPDIIYINSMFSVVFSIIPLFHLWRQKHTSKVIIAPRGMLHGGAIKFKSKRKKLYLLVLRKLGFSKLWFYHATDEQESQDIQHWLGVSQRSVYQIPNIPAQVDTNFVVPAKSKNELRLVYISRITQKKNLLFLLDSLKYIKGEVKLSIYGVQESNYWTSCKDVIAELPSKIEVRYFGPIKHNEVLRVLGDNHFFVLPTLGENFGHSIYESFAAGRPVIISDQTPWQNLEEQNLGWDIPLTDTAKWRENIQLACDMDQEEFNSYCSSSREFAVEFMRKSDFKNRYLRMIE